MPLEDRRLDRGCAPELRQEVKEVAVAGGKKDLLSSDPQLSAAVLLLRLQLADARL